MRLSKGYVFPDIRRDILTIQLLEVGVVLIKAIEEWAEDNGIILGKSKKLDMLLNEARCLIEELDHVQVNQKSHKLLSDEFLQRDESDEDFTEPKITRFI